MALALAGVVGVVLILFVQQLQGPSPAEPMTPQVASASLGYFLGRWGLVLTLIGFVPLVVSQVMGAFVWGGAGPTAKSVLPGEGLWKQVVSALPNLIKTPIGVGMVLIVIGALLLIGSSMTMDQVTPGANPTPTRASTP